MTGGLGTTEAIEPAGVLAFWRSAGPNKWFEKDALFDAEIARRFSALWHVAGEGKLRHWEDTAEGALALVIVLDQFPRNMFRGDGRCYATDEFARSVADRAIRRGFDRQMPHAERQFFYSALFRGGLPSKLLVSQGYLSTRGAKACRVSLLEFPLYFQRFLMAPGGSTRYACDTTGARKCPQDAEKPNNLLSWTLLSFAIPFE